MAKGSALAAWILRAVPTPQLRPQPTRTGHLIGAFVLTAMALLMGAAAAVTGYVAWRHHSERVLYEERAVVATAVITGFETRTSKGRGNAVINTTAPVVEFGVDGRTVRYRLTLAQPVVPSERGAQVGRSIEVRYPPGRPDRVIAAGAMPQLPSVGGWALFTLLPLCLMGVGLYQGAAEALRALKKRR